jgi:hypothetical protein
VNGRLVNDRARNEFKSILDARVHDPQRARLVRAQSLRGLARTIESTSGCTRITDDDIAALVRETHWDIEHRARGAAKVATLEILSAVLIELEGQRGSLLSISNSDSLYAFWLSQVVIITVAAVGAIVSVLSRYLEGFLVCNFVFAYSVVSNIRASSFWRRRETIESAADVSRSRPSPVFDFHRYIANSQNGFLVNSIWAVLWESVIIFPMNIPIVNFLAMRSFVDRHVSNYELFSTVSKEFRRTYMRWVVARYRGLPCEAELLCVLTTTADQLWIRTGNSGYKKYIEMQSERLAPLRTTMETTS